MLRYHPATYEYFRYLRLSGATYRPFSRVREQQEPYLPLPVRASDRIYTVLVLLCVRMPKSYTPANHITTR